MVRDCRSCCQVGRCDDLVGRTVCHRRVYCVLGLARGHGPGDGRDRGCDRRFARIGGRLGVERIVNGCRMVVCLCVTVSRLAGLLMFAKVVLEAGQERIRVRYPSQHLPRVVGVRCGCDVDFAQTGHPCDPNADLYGRMPRWCEIEAVEVSVSSHRLFGC